MNTIVKVKKLVEDAVLPKYGTEFSAGADLVNAGGDVVVESGKTVIIHTGIAMEIPVISEGMDDLLDQVKLKIILRHSGMIKSLMTN